MKRGNPLLLISGTPASGKDTVTKLLCRIDPRFRHFRKHRSSDRPKPDGSYIHVAPETFDSMAARGEFQQHHFRYGRGYGVARSELARHWAAGEIPVIHVGKYENISPFLVPDVAATSVLLMTSLPESRRRLDARHADDPGEVERRLVAYNEERAELADLVRSGSELAFDVILDNSHQDPAETAQFISRILTERAVPGT